MTLIKPYQNESESLTIGGLTVENRTDRIAIYGNIHLTRDKAGLAQARVLKTLVDGVVQALESEKALPDRIELTNKPRPARNPFV